MPGIADAATAPGLGPPPQHNAVLSGLAGLGMAQQNSLDPLFWICQGEPACWNGRLECGLALG